MPTPTTLVWPVSFLLSSARLLLEEQIGPVWVSGEISGFTRAASGHCYFTLKDDKAQVRCTLWRHKAQTLRLPKDGLRDGLYVELKATPTIYEMRGDFQLTVETLKLAGQGALYEKFLRMKASLEAEGLFADVRKKTPPEFPQGVALVTSAHGAALHDMLTTLHRRWPQLPVVIYPTMVQGNTAAEQITQAIQTANRRAQQDGVDVLIVARGGGSLEDLWAFNEEIVVRAIAASTLPVISGIGHETDFTLSDFAADIRAPTPTAAAMLAAPDGAAWRRIYREQMQRFQRAMAYRLAQWAQHLDETARQLTHPQTRLDARYAQLHALRQRMAHAWRQQTRPLAQQFGFVCSRLLHQTMQPFPQHAAWQKNQRYFRDAVQRYLTRCAQSVESTQTQLALLNPQQVLERGYAIVHRGKNNEIVRDAQTLDRNETVHIRFAHGEALADIQTTNPYE